MTEKSITLFFGILEVEFENGIILRITSNSYGTLKHEGKREKKNFDEEFVWFSFDGDIKVDSELKEKIKEKNIEVDKKAEEWLNSINEWLKTINDNKLKEDKIINDLITPCKIKSLKGIDLPCEYNQIENKLKISDNSGVCLNIFLEKKNTDRGRLKIFEHTCIRLSETPTYDIEAEKTDKSNSSNLSIKLSSETISGNFITPFGKEKNKCHINFQGYTFFGNILVCENINIVAKLPVLVFPVKLNPEEAETILNELIEKREEITKPSPTGIYIEPGDAIVKTPLQTLLLIRQMFKDDRNGKPSLTRTFLAIRSNPDKVIRTRMVEREPQEVISPDVDSILEAITSARIRRAEKNISHFSYGRRDFAFTALLDEETYISYDTYPNRFLKYFLEFLKITAFKCIDEVRGKSEYEHSFTESIIHDVEEGIKRDVQGFLYLDWMQNVQHLTHLAPPPQKLLKDPFYSSAFFDYLDLIKNLKLVDERFEEYLRNPITYMPELYELWCGIKLEEITGKRVERQHCFGSTGHWRSYSVPLRPDFGIKINETLILLDAKYRVDFEEIEEKKLDSIKREELRGTFKLGDLYKMHTYREAIICRTKRGNKTILKRPVFVFILYPGEKIAIFTTKKKHFSARICFESGSLLFETENDRRNYRVEDKDKEILLKATDGNDSIRISRGVGAIPFKPSLLMNESYRKFLHALFDAIIHKD